MRRDGLLRLPRADRRLGDRHRPRRASAQRGRDLTGRAAHPRRPRRQRGRGAAAQAAARQAGEAGAAGHRRAVSAVGIDLKPAPSASRPTSRRSAGGATGPRPERATGTVADRRPRGQRQEGRGRVLPAQERPPRRHRDRRRPAATASRTVKIVRKEALPTSIYTRTGPARLVLVTCGGPFNAKTGHYRDNVDRHRHARPLTGRVNSIQTVRCRYQGCDHSAPHRPRCTGPRRRGRPGHCRNG